MRTTTALLINKKLPSKEWDFEWDCTKGLMSENGFTKTITGNASEALTANGILLTARNDGYVNLQSPIAKCDKSVVEIIAVIKEMCAYNNGIRWVLGNGSQALQIYINRGYMYAEESTEESVANEQLNLFNIQPMEVDREYKVRLEFDINSGCKVFVDDVLMYDKFIFSKIWVQGGNRIWQQTLGSTIYKSVKYKFLGGDNK